MQKKIKIKDKLLEYSLYLLEIRDPWEVATDRDDIIEPDLEMGAPPCIAPPGSATTGCLCCLSDAIAVIYLTIFQPNN